MNKKLPPLTDQIRAYILKSKVKTARLQGQTLLTLWAREIQAEMHLALPVQRVCQAMDSLAADGVTFSAETGVILLERSGPKRSPAAKWVFEIQPG